MWIGYSTDRRVTSDEIWAALILPRAANRRTYKLIFAGFVWLPKLLPVQRDSFSDDRQIFEKAVTKVKPYLKWILMGDY